MLVILLEKGKITRGKKKREMRDGLLRLRRDPSTPRPDAPEYGAKKKSGRCGRDDRFLRDRKR